MNLLSQRDARSELETLTPNRTGPEPSFGETAGAAFQFGMDEMLSISSQLNNQGYFDRQKEVRQMKTDGFDFNPYTNEKGDLDYNRIAKNTGLIKTDGELRTERNAILAERRAYSQDVMGRGPASATFLGMGGAILLDPINIATLPIGFGTAAKGLTVLSHALRGARNTAAVGVASELAIQPLVFNHKHDINSPYEVEDAIKVIGFTAIGAGVLGGAFGGIGGYFARSAEAAAEEAVKFTSIVPRADAKKFVRFTPTGKIDPRYRPTFEDVSVPILQNAKVELTALAGQKITRGTRKSILSEIQIFTGQIEKLDASLVRRSSTGKILSTSGSRAKKIDRNQVAIDKAAIKEKIDSLNNTLANDNKASLAEADLTRIEQGIIPEKYSLQINKMLETNPLSESARVMARIADSLVKERGFVVSDLPLQAYKMAKNAGKEIEEIKQAAVNSLDSQIKNATSESQKLELQNLKAQIDDLNADQIDEFMAQLHKTAVENDVQLMNSMVYKQDQASKPNIKVSDYELVEVPSAPRASTTSLERASLDRDGIGKEFDNIMAQYNTLSSKRIYNEAGELVDADDVIKTADNELEGLESIMRCSIG